MKKLIIIDDEICFLESISTLFDWSTMNFELAATFTDSSAALSYLEEHPVDAILSDIKMPQMSGLELAKICQEKYPHIKIAFLTAYSNFEYAKTAIKYNVTDYILKATSFSELSASIEEFLLPISAESQADSICLSENMERFQKQQIFTNLLLGMIHSREELLEQLAEVGLTEVDFAEPCSLLTLMLEDFNQYLQGWHHTREQFYQAIEQMFLSCNPDLSFHVTRYAHDKLEFLVLSKRKTADFEKALENSLLSFYQNTASILKINVHLLERKDFPSPESLINEREIEFNADSVNPNTIIEKTRQYIEKNYQKSILLTDIAAHVALSPTYFSAYYKKVTHSNFNIDLNKFRIQKAKEILETTPIKASQVFHMVGYQSYTYFYKIFKEYTGMTPANYQTKYSKNKNF